MKKTREPKPIGGAKNAPGQLSVSQTPQTSALTSIPHQALPTSQQQAMIRQSLVTHPAPQPVPAQTAAPMVLENAYDMSQSNTGS